MRRNSRGPEQVCTPGSLSPFVTPLTDRSQNLRDTHMPQLAGTPEDGRGKSEDRRGLPKVGGDRRRWAGTAEDGQECSVVSGNKATSETQRIDYCLLTRSRTT